LEAAFIMCTFFQEFRDHAPFFVSLRVLRGRSVADIFGFAVNSCIFRSEEPSNQKTSQRSSRRAHFFVKNAIEIRERWAALALAVPPTAPDLDPGRGSYCVSCT
jgi:hypothetical protein